MNVGTTFGWPGRWRPKYLMNGAAFAMRSPPGVVGTITVRVLPRKWLSSDDCAHAGAPIIVRAVATIRGRILSSVIGSFPLSTRWSELSPGDCCHDHSRQRGIQCQLTWRRLSPIKIPDTEGGMT